MKTFQAILCVISVVLSSSTGQLEDFEYEEQEIEATAGKIGNGTLSEHIPFLASLRLKLEDSPFGKGHICGAVFITRQYLLTAAVCVVRIDKDYGPEELEVVAGIRSRYDDSGAYSFKVSEVIVRSEYLRWPVMGMDGNLAILKVRTMSHRAHGSTAPL